MQKVVPEDPVGIEYFVFLLYVNRDGPQLLLGQDT